MADKNIAALEQSLCEVCGNVFETGNILLDKTLRGFDNKFLLIPGVGQCTKCEEKVKKGFIALVVIRNGKNLSKTTMRQEEANRTGDIAWLKKEVACEMFGRKIDTSLIFIDEDIFELLKTMKEKADDKEH